MFTGAEPTESSSSASVPGNEGSGSSKSYSDLSGAIHSWNGNTRTHFEGECGSVSGSAGGFYPPGRAGQSLELFSHETCR